MKIKIKKMSKLNLATKVMLVLSSILIAVAVPMRLMQEVSATQVQDAINEYNQKDQALQQEYDTYIIEAEKLKSQVVTLQSAVDDLRNQAAAIQVQIDISQVKHDKLVVEIADTEQKINDNKDALGITIADMYVGNNITPIEMLAGSKNISDYLDKQEYQSSIRDELSSTITKIKELKSQLDAQKIEVKAILDKQIIQKESLVATQTQQQTLLNQTQGQESAYQQLAIDIKAKRDEAAATLRAKIAQYGSSGNVGIGGGDGYVGPPPLGPFGYKNLTPNAPCPAGGYPYCGGQDSYSDPYRLFNRECVSYAAWAADITYGKYVDDTYGFRGMGMAYEFAETARVYMGATVNNTPEVGAVAILPPLADFAEVGHAMIVDSIIDSEWVHVSQYNFGSDGQYSEMDIKSTGVVYVHFQNRS